MAIILIISIYLEGFLFGVTVDGVYAFPDFCLECLEQDIVRHNFLRRSGCTEVFGISLRKLPALPPDNTVRGKVFTCSQEGI